MSSRVRSRKVVSSRKSVNKRKASVYRVCLELETRYGDDLVGFVRDHVNFDGLRLGGPTGQQVEMMEEWMKWRRVCISGGGGIGKTAVAAWAVIWGLLCHCHSKILVTGPTGNQLSDVLWSEVGFWVNRCRFGKLLELKSRWMHVKGFRDWRASLRVKRREERGDVQVGIDDKMAGMHARWMCAVVDEGSSVGDDVYTAIEGAMTQEDSYIFIISNPVSTGGYYYDTITAEPDERGLCNGYRVLKYSSLGSELVDDTYEQMIIRRYGRDSAMYRAKVLGEALEGGSSRAVVLPGEFDRVVSENRGVDNSDEVVISIDPSAAGGDRAVVLFRRGKSLVEWCDLEGVVDAEGLCDLVERIWRAKYAHLRCVCIVDAIGSDVNSILRRRRLFPVVDHVGSSKPLKQHVYLNRRTEVYVELSEVFSQLHFPVRPPERLKKELANLLILRDDDSGLLYMEPKKKFRKRLGFSPDYADVLSMSVSIDSIGMVKSDAIMTDGVASILNGGGSGDSLLDIMMGGISADGGMYDGFDNGGFSGMMGSSNEYVNRFL